MEFHLDFNTSSYENDGRRKMQDTYRRKYNALKRKCDLIELSNERVLNRLCHVKRYIHRLSRERRGLSKKLTELGDEFKKTDLTIPLEDDLPFNALGASESPSSSSVPPTGGGHGAPSPPGAMETEEAPQPYKQPPAPSGPGHSKSGSKKKRSKDVNKSEKEKDPNAPKKPANAFLMYCQQERQKVQDGEGNGIYPADLSHQDLTRQLAKQWKFLSEEEKKHYYLMYEKEKDRYDKAVKRYAKAGGDKKNAKREEEAEAESETIDVVKMGQEHDVKKKELKEVKVNIKASSNEDQNVDVEKDEFEFTDFPIVVDEPKICLEKIDKSKLFDKARLFGLSSPEYKTQRSESGSKGVPVTDLLLNTSDMKIPSRMLGVMDYRGPSILEIKSGPKTSAAATFSTPLGPGIAPPGIAMKPSGELTIKELVGMRAGAAFDLPTQPMMELKPKSPSEDRTVLASALRNKSMFDMKPRYTQEHSLPKSSLDMTTARMDTHDSRASNFADIRNKAAAEVKSRINIDMKARLDSKPRLVGDSKGKPTPDTKVKPAIVEVRSPAVSEIKVKPSPEFRRMSLDNKKPVVELKKISVDPSDDPYHFDD